jgi:hypothetical protein
MWAEQSKISSSTPTPKMTKRRVVDVGMFVTSNINAAFDALQQDGFLGSNCYHLLYVLTHSTITSDEFQAIQGRLFEVVPQGITNISDVFPIIYYRMFQRVLTNTSDLNVQKLLQYKEAWLRNPSRFVNAILGETGARKIITQGVDAQNNAISKACKYITPSSKSAGGAGEECSTRVVFKGATFEQQNQCCICGLGDPPPLMDIEHVVSSQLLILLGLCSGTKSLVGFQDIFNGLHGASRTNWVEIIINYFPENKRATARRAFRSMLLPAHAYCNQTIKKEWSPFYIDEKGNILANINKPFEDMDGQTYAQRVIIQSILFANAKRSQKSIPPKLVNTGLQDYITRWITTQQKTFSDIAWFLNSIDQRNNDASWFLFNHLYNVARDGDNILDKAAFAELVTNILGYKDVINWKDIESVLENDENKLKIKTTLTLLVETILVLFQADVQTPTIKATPTNSSGRYTQHSGSDADNELSSDTSFTSESELSDIEKQASSSSDDESQNSNSKSQSSASDTSSTFSLRDRIGSKRSESPIKQFDRIERRIKRATLNDNQIIEMQANAAVNDYYGRSDVLETTRNNAMRISTNAARNALNNATDDTDPYDITYNAAMAELIDYNNGNISVGLGGGSRKRKYTTTRRRSTRKRRPSRKPRRTIRRRRNNNKRTKTRRK